MGTVDAGKNADLVLLNANPLLQVSNLAKIAGVVNAGKYLSQADLDALKASVATAYANAPLRNVEAVLDHSHKH
jgi:imidazolonepropionase-like amidohydrolase